MHSVSIVLAQRDEAVSLQVCGVLVYHNEPALVIMFIGYVLFDKLCPLQIRIGAAY